MLPEMFSSANDCARIPVTAVVSAPKIPMTVLHCRPRTLMGPGAHDPVETIAIRMPLKYMFIFNKL